jgi:hypothetical protein
VEATLAFRERQASILHRLGKQPAQISTLMEMKQTLIGLAFKKWPAPPGCGLARRGGA